MSGEKHWDNVFDMDLVCGDAVRYKLIIFWAD